MNTKILVLLAMVATIAAVNVAGDITSGMEIYQFTESGIALQATVAGTKYWKDKELN